MKAFSLLVLTFCLSFSALAEKAKYIKARILPNVSHSSAGSDFMFGIQFDMVDGWYSYWQNPGDSGLAPNFNWSLPKGVEVGKAMFPVPELKVVEGINNFVYKKKVLFLFPVKVSESYKGQFIRAKVDIDWLVCKESCIPESDSLSLQVPIRDQQVINGAVNKYFESWKAKVPVTNSDLKLKAKVSGKELVLRGEYQQGFEKVDIFPMNPEVLIDVQSKQSEQDSFSQKFTLDLPLKEAGFVVHLQRSGKDYYIYQYLSLK